MGVSALELRRRVLMAQPHRERKTGGIVSFNTHVPQVLPVAVDLLPVQAGTGDPYPPGGGINLINVADRTINLNNQYYADNMPLGFSPVAGETYTFSVEVTTTEVPFNVSIGCGTSGYARDIASASGNSSGRVTLTFTPTEAQLEGRPNLFIRAPRYMTKQTATAEVKNYQLEKGSTAHDFAPYSNIRPISGHTGAAVWDDPKHGGLIKWNQLNALNAPNAWTTINEDGSVTITSTESTKTTYGHVSMLAETPFLSDHVYMLYTPGFFNNNGIRFYTARGSSDPIVAGKEARFYKNLASSQTFIRSVIPAHEGTVSVTTFVMLFDLTEMFGAEVADGIYSAPYETALSWFKSLFFKEWYPFNAGEITCVSAVNGETHRHQAFTFPDTVYGGRLEPAAGRLVVDRKKVVFNGSESWAVYTNSLYGNSYNVTIADKKIEELSSVCDSFTNIAGCWGSNGKDKFGVFSDHGSIGRLYFRAPNNSVTDLAGWKAWLADNPIEVVYFLATPAIVPLTPAEIRALMGENNVFADTGDVEVEFWTN